VTLIAAFIFPIPLIVREISSLSKKTKLEIEFFFFSLKKSINGLASEVVATMKCITLFYKF